MKTDVTKLTAMTQHYMKLSIRQTEDSSKKKKQVQGIRKNNYYDCLGCLEGVRGCKDNVVRQLIPVFDDRITYSTSFA